MKNNKIKILFDAGPMVNGKRTGVGYYTYGLISALAAINPDSVELVGHYFDFLGRRQNIDLPSAPNIRYRRTVLFPGKIPNLLRRIGISLPFEFFAKERGSFILYPGFLGWPSLFNTPSAPAIHDLSYLEHPDYVSARNQQALERFVPTTIKRASFIITISEDTKKKIESLYIGVNKRIVVGHIPPTDTNSRPEKTARKLLQNLGINKKYILFIGTIEPRKNIVGLVRAYELLPEVVRDKYSLVLAGGKGWNDDEIQSALSEAKLNNLDVIQTGYINNDERAALYQLASVFVLPSHYEGFGMPLLEAMSYKVPIVVSDIPVLHEVAGDAAIYCDRDSPRDIAEKISGLLQDEKLRSRLVDKGDKRLKDFSWDNTARKIFDQIKEVVDEDHN